MDIATARRFLSSLPTDHPASFVFPHAGLQDYFHEAAADVKAKMTDAALALVEHGDDPERELALGFLGAVPGSAEASATLIRIYRDKGWDGRHAAATTLARSGHRMAPENVAALRALFLAAPEANLPFSRVLLQREPTGPVWDALKGAVDRTGDPELLHWACEAAYAAEREGELYRHIAARKSTEVIRALAARMGGKRAAAFLDVCRAVDGEGARATRGAGESESAQAVLDLCEASADAKATALVRRISDDANLDPAVRRRFFDELRAWLEAADARNEAPSSVIARFMDGPGQRYVGRGLETGQTLPVGSASAYLDGVLSVALRERVSRVLIVPTGTAFYRGETLHLVAAPVGELFTDVFEYCRAITGISADAPDLPCVVTAAASLAPAGSQGTGVRIQLVGDGRTRGLQFVF